MRRKDWMRPRFPSEEVPWKKRMLLMLVGLTMVIYLTLVYMATA